MIHNHYFFSSQADLSAAGDSSQYHGLSWYCKPWVPNIVFTQIGKKLIQWIMFLVFLEKLQSTIYHVTIYANVFFSWLLGQLYVPSTRPKIQRLMSEFAAVFILLPGWLSCSQCHAHDWQPLHPFLNCVEGT